MLKMRRRHSGKKRKEEQNQKLPKRGAGQKCGKEEGGKKKTKA